MEKHGNIYFLALIAVSISAMTVLVFWSVRTTKVGIPETVGLASEVTTVDLAEATKEEILSPDGKYTLVMENKSAGEGRVLQTFIITPESEEFLQIFSKDVPKNDLIVVPFNTFSPDNRYVFLRSSELGNDEFLVIRTDGKNIKGDAQTVEIIDLFNQKYPDFEVTDVTGWGGMNLIVVNTDLKEGGVGPSFWFDLSNHSFIRLGSRFN